MGMIDISGDSPEVAALDFNMARDMAEALHEAYPGHAWAVTCEGEKGLASVRNLALAGNWGFVLHLKTLSSASDWKKKVVMAGGELLERFRLRRGMADSAAIADLPTNRLGRVMGDYS